MPSKIPRGVGTYVVFPTLYSKKKIHGTHTRAILTKQHVVQFGWRGRAAAPFSGMNSEHFPQPAELLAAKKKADIQRTRDGSIFEFCAVPYVAFINPLVCLRVCFLFVA